MRRNLFIVYGLFFVSLSILGGLSYLFYKRYSVYTQYADAVEHTYQTITELNRLATFLKDAETGQRGFLLASDSAFLEPYDAGVEHLKETFLAIKNLTYDNRDQQERLDALNILIQEKLKSMDHTRFMFIFNKKVYLKNFKISQEKMDECRSILATMEHDELELLRTRKVTKEAYQSTTPEYLKALFSFSAFTFVVSFVLIIREFRGRVKYQKELEQKINEVKQSNMELEQITHVASHDLQEPLRKINTFSDRLELKYAPQLDDEGKTIIGRISYASLRMRELIEDLANYTSLVKRTEAKVTVDLTSLIEDITIAYKEIIAKKNIRITWETLPLIKGHTHQLLLLFESLIDNSIKFTRTDVIPVITITSDAVLPEELDSLKLNNPMTQYIKINIRDNGIGFENEFSEKMFGIFQRLHNQHSEYTGKGEGLAIVKRVMTNHNGFVLAKGKENEGALFSLFFPI